MTSIVATPDNQEELTILEDFLNKMEINYKLIIVEKDNIDDDEEWNRFSMQNLLKAYSDDEPEYTSDMIKDSNQGYNPNFIQFFPH